MSDKEKEVIEEEAAAEQEAATAETEACTDETVEAKAENTEEAAEKTEESEESEAGTEEDKQEASQEEDGEKAEGGILKGFKKKDKKLEALENQKKELEDKVMRQMAEFENYRKRTEKEKATMFEMGAKSVIEKMLPVVDNFERGLASVDEDKQSDPIYEGMNLIYKQLMGELDKLGVKPIEALGQEFNPDLHNAVMQVESEEYEEGIVAQELQKGYMYRDSVVRHSMVAVAQ